MLLENLSCNPETESIRALDSTEFCSTACTTDTESTKSLTFVSKGDGRKGARGGEREREKKIPNRERFVTCRGRRRQTQNIIHAVSSEARQAVSGAARARARAVALQPHGDGPPPAPARTTAVHRAIMKSKLQIMTGHNSRSLSRALCPIVAVTPVRWHADASLRAPMGFNAHLNPRVYIHAKPTDAICRANR